MALTFLISTTIRDQGLVAKVVESLALLGCEAKVREYESTEKSKPAPKRRLTTAEDVEKIRRHIEQGKYVKDFAAEIGLTPAAIRGVMHRKGIRSRARRPEKYSDAEILAATGTYRAAEAASKISRSTLHRRRQQIVTVDKAKDDALRAILIAEAVAAGRVRRITPEETAEYNTRMARGTPKQLLGSNR